jgi:hypothetical protein
MLRGVNGALTDTTLELHDKSGTVTTNDDWKIDDKTNTNQQASVEATGIAPSDDREAAILVSLGPGAYTTLVQGKNNEAGIGLAEVYDLDPTSPAKLGNISTRGRVQTGDGVMIGGVIVQGTGSSRVLVRGIGPSLQASGVENALVDPMLELHDANGGVVVSNDDWKLRDASKGSQQDEIVATTIPPSDDRESAVLATLFPGNYTAILRGKDGSTGVGLIEAYNLD